MGTTELILIAIGLSMDAFATSICKGLCMKKINYGQTFIIALFFGGFQALMPLLGWFLGSRLQSIISTYDHWVVFALLSFIGIRMIRESLAKDKEENCTVRLDLKELLMLAIATSIDALAVGIGLALLPGMDITRAILVIGFITFAISFVGVMIGNRFGTRFKNKAETAGGILLVLIGLKILLQHLGFIHF
ncbi:MAG: manganese efflux pump MntP family protein [Spirochaetia bacterium]|jgi:putative Mn2+ efflux pump MntP|nr:manganese efflux pump MntP family protein [Spirochaetia bacterium]